MTNATSKINCRIPFACLTSDRDVSQQVRAQLRKAIEAGLKPATIPHNTQVQSVSFLEEDAKAVTHLAQELGIAPGRVVGGLLYARHLLEGRHDTQSASEAFPPNVLGLRADQARAMQEMAPLMATGKIVFTEAGTGAGKARLIAHAASHALTLRAAKALPPIRPATGPGPENPFATQQEKASRLNASAAADAQAVQTARLGLLTGNAPQPVMICAPSIENVVHLVKEWLVVRNDLDPCHSLTYAIVLGRKQFVCARQLSNLLLNMREDGDAPPPAIEKWLLEGMPAGLTPATRTLKELVPDLSGLMDDLEYLSEATSLRPKHAALEPDDDEDDSAIYKAMRERAYSADIVFTTTAMVCMNNMLLTRGDRAPLLPYPAALLIDEAHELEAIQAGCAAKSFSFYTLFTSLRNPVWKPTPAKEAMNIASDAIKHLRDIPDETRIPILPDGDHSHYQMWIAALPKLSALHDQLSRLSKGISETARRSLRPDQSAALRYVEKSIKALGYIKNEYRGHITHSPKIGKIGFELGPSSVSRRLTALWATIPTAVLTSGTLYHIGASGPTNTYTKWELSVPSDRDANTIPLHPAWITNSPTLMVPSSSNFHRLVPPPIKTSDDELMRHWLSECSKVVVLAADSAKGGTLVLFTSFQRLNTMADLLSDKHADLRPRLIIQSTTERVGACTRKFKELAAQGIRPIWLATGAAWVGLNLSDDTLPPEQDTLLTDLIMPNLPFGLSRSTTHISRIQNGGFYVEMIAVQKKFRQGIGRLVRRSGLQDRRVWILDGRLLHPAHTSYIKDLRIVLRSYVKTQTFDF